MRSRIPTRQPTRTPGSPTWAPWTSPPPGRIKVDGVAVGGIGVAPDEGVFAKSAEFGYWLAEPYWRRGIMTEAVRALVPLAMARFGLCRLESAVFAWNPASMRVLEKCGFARAGISRSSVFKDGELIDRVVYALVDVGDCDKRNEADAAQVFCTPGVPRAQPIRGALAGETHAKLRRIQRS